MLHVVSGARLEVRHVTGQCRVRSDRRDVVRCGSAGVFFLWWNGCGVQMSAKRCASSSAPSDMGTRDGSLPRATESLPPTALVRVVAHIWGLTADDQDCAERAARWGWSRRGWDFVTIGRSADETCPLDLRDGKSLAAGSGRGWAYVVYPAGCATSLLQERREPRDVRAPVVVANPVGASDA